MGFVTNKWQPVSAGPGPIPVPTWEQVKNGVTATTNFSYSSLNYTEYLILLYHKNTTNKLYEMFYTPAYGTSVQYAGYTDVIITLTPQNNSSLKFAVTTGSSSGTRSQTSNYRYKIYGRNKATWSQVSDKTAIPNYTELCTSLGYYTPFKYQESYYRVGGGSTWVQSSSTYVPSFSGSVEQVNSDRYTGNGNVFTRLSSNEANWNHITSTTASVSIADISYSEMFIISKRMQHKYGNSNQYTFQSLYVIPDMPNGTYYTGGYTGRYTSRYNGSYGYIITSDTSISAYCSINSAGNPTNTFVSLDIYYR